MNKRFFTLHKSRIVLSILFLLLCPSLLQAKETWTRLRTQNFTIIGNASERDMRKVALQLEEFRYTISLLLPKAKITTNIPTVVVLFKSHDSFKPFKPLYKGKVQENVGGYFQRTADINYIALTAETRGLNPLEVIFHEYEHFVIDNNLNRAPLWFNEGMAEFYSTFEPADDGSKFHLGTPIARHIVELRQGTLLPLDKLLNVSHKSPEYNERGKVGMFYAESWALIHYLMLGEEGKRRPQLSQFIANLNGTLSVEENFRQSFQTDYQTMEKELRQYIGRFTFPAITYIFKKQLDYAKDANVTALSEAEVNAQLGDLLMRTGRAEEAGKRLQQAIALDDHFAPAYLSLGELRLRERKLPEAKPLIEKALALDADNYQAHYLYGTILDEENQIESAMNEYRKAAALKSDIAKPHVALAYDLVRLKREDEAMASFQKAVQLDPRDPNIRRARSYIYLRLGRGFSAAMDATTYLRQQGWRDDHAQYMALVAVFGSRQAHRDADATRFLNDAASKCDTAEWPYPVMRYLSGQLKEAELFSLATDNDKQTEAHAYVGLDLSLKGNTEAALNHLKWVKENGNKNFVEYALALAEIERLESSATVKQ